tara:strand:+ start:1192 stop:2559 length:1368 start_codon:yes stop_codon:yes gene_type:complete
MSQAVDQDLICAIATPLGQGGIGVVRLSGAGAKQVAETICARKLVARSAVYCQFFHESEHLDDGIALWFPEPHSFTGEEVVELQGHGGPVVQQRIINALCSLGVRLARPGEFSERAFHNGKLDLAQAEGIADLIASTSEAAARAALNTLRGDFSNKVNALIEELTMLRVQVEAAIDFPDEEIEILEQAGVVNALNGLAKTLTNIIASANQGRLLSNGVQVALIGAPNVGKSSLLNALAEEDAAIVTDIPGTTRDLLKVDLLVNDLPIRLIDTAGLRESSDTVEQQGVARARAQIAKADIVLMVVAAPELSVSAVFQQLADLETEAQEEPFSLARALVVVNKADLAPPPDLPEQINHVKVSALTGAGIDQLKTKLHEFVGFTDESTEFSARARHVDALKAAVDQVAAAQLALHDGLAAELVAEELALAQHHLGSITGDISADELLGRIFSEFCIGK